MDAAARLRATSVATKLYPEAGHGFDIKADDPSAVAARKETIDFFVRHCRGRENDGALGRTRQAISPSPRRSICS